MSKAKHTPGPWEVSHYTNYSGFSIHAKDIGCIAERWWPSEKEINIPIHANARLIAAAPDLLEALKIALDFINTHNVCYMGDEYQGERDRQYTAREFVRMGGITLAIAKAEGEA